MDSLIELLSSRVKAEIFRLLFATEGRELHVREIGRQAALNDATVRQELKRLTRIGVVRARQDGNRLYYHANNEHPLYPDIHNLVLKTSGLVDALRAALDNRGIAIAFVFGSLANGTEKARSDVDLMIIGNVSLRQVGK